MRTTPARPYPRRRRRPWTAWVLVLAVAVTACRPDDPEIAVTGVPRTGGAAATTGDGEPVTVTARDIAFDVTRIEATAGTPLRIIFDNDDTDVPHNLLVELGTDNVQTNIAPGPDVQEMGVTIDEPGFYDFICVVHPVQMTGVIEVSS